MRVDSRTGGEGSDGSLDADANVSNGTNPSNGPGGDFPGAKVRSAPLTRGWVPGSDISRYSDALDYVLAAYNVGQDRIYIWGFSAGAHIVHGVALTNTDTFTGYSVSAGVLDASAGGNAPATVARQIPVGIHIGTEDPLFSGSLGKMK